MKPNLKKIAEIVAQANDLFYASNPNVGTVIGIMDKTLRKQGMQADAVTLDCIALDRKVVFLMHDNKPIIVDVALGNKAGDIHSSSEYDFNKISVATVIELMETNFL